MTGWLAASADTSGVALGVRPDGVTKGNTGPDENLLR